MKETEKIDKNLMQREKAQTLTPHYMALTMKTLEGITAELEGGRISPSHLIFFSSWPHEFIQKITYFILNQLPTTFQEGINQQSFKVFSVQR